MLAPRAFLFTRPPKSYLSSSEKSYEEIKSDRKTQQRDVIRETPPPPPKTPAVSMARPTTSEPVIIPVPSSRPASRGSQDDRMGRRHSGATKSPARSSVRRTQHSPDSIPPAVAALLAVTSIPPPKWKTSLTRNSRSEPRLTVDAVLRHTSAPDKAMSISLGRGPMDVLLSPPDDLDEAGSLTSSEAGRESYLSSRTISSESVPSLDNTSPGEETFSLGNPVTPSSRGKKSLPTRRMEPLSSPPGEPVAEHPLSSPAFDMEELDFRVFEKPSRAEDDASDSTLRAPPRKSAFKSNLTASLRALKSAARSISSIAANPMIMPDDFLTRSIISIDPHVPFTDERMPPLLDDTPTAALRRYLNPTTNAPVDAHMPMSLAQTTSPVKCITSIQMQTYKVSKSTKSTPLSPGSAHHRTNTTSAEEVFAEVAAGPLARQRDMRENSDFIRIAVMEMMMRKNGKLDEKTPGRAKWALPPRKPSTKPYEIGEGGVPVRWIGITA